jgi:hypothetical protein
VVTRAAFFAARVYNEACRREANEEPFDNWNSLHADERLRLAKGFDYLFTEDVMKRIDYYGLKQLYKLKWDWVKPPR